MMGDVRMLGDGIYHHDVQARKPASQWMKKERVSLSDPYPSTTTCWWPNPSQPQAIRSHASIRDPSINDSQPRNPLLKRGERIAKGR